MEIHLNDWTESRSVPNTWIWKSNIYLGNSCHSFPDKFWLKTLFAESKMQTLFWKAIQLKDSTVLFAEYQIPNVTFKFNFFQGFLSRGLTWFNEY